MIVRLLLWNLSDSMTTLDELRTQLPESPNRIWISDEATERWGAIYVWETEAAARQELPSRARELIGKEPDIGEEFDIEATIEGRFELEALSRLGLAFED